MTAGARIIGKTIGLLALAASTTACGVLPNGRAWGQDATLFPDPARIQAAAVNAALEPETWAPALGAAVFGIGGFDSRVSLWASENTPIFGSPRRARRASDILVGAASAGWLATALATPSGVEPGGWAVAKFKGVGIEIGAHAATQGLTVGLKRTTRRLRPDRSDRESFPSGHASGAFASATLASRNLDSLPLTGPARIGLRAGFLAVAGGAAWARVEGKRHHPSDVLAGAALGHFVTAFLHDAFLGLDRRFSLYLTVEPGWRGGIAGFAWRF